MKENYLLKPYHDLLNKIVNKGIDTGITKALYNEFIRFDLTSLNSFKDNKRVYKLFLPDKRGLKDTSVKYGIAEAVWYRQATRTIDSIVKYGKIWNEMTDENGLINSNYGYQIKNNNDVIGNIKDLKNQFDKYGLGIVEFYIANKENQFSRTDCTCNNKIVISLFKQNNNIVLDCNVYARSIDVMFGLPYDTFTFNGFMAMIAEELMELYDHKKDILLSSLAFNVVNIHWYKRDDINKEALNNLTNDAILINNTDTPYTNLRKDFSNYSAQDIIEVRNEAATKTTTKEITVKNNDFSYLKNIMLNAYIYKNIENIEQLQETLLSFISKKDDLANKRVLEVVQYLKNNSADRKTIIMTEDNDLIYAYTINDKYYITIYKSLK